MSEAGFSQNITTERGLHSDVNTVEGLSEQFRSDETQHAETIGRNRVNKLKVLHVAATASGANWMFDILRGLRSRGYEASALISGAQGDLAPKLEREGIPYYVADLDLFSASTPISAARRILRLTSFLRKHRFDIVHYHLFASVISGRIAAWLIDVPLRYSMITGPYHLEAPTPSEIDRKTAWMDTRVIASCEYTRQLYVKMGVPWEKIERIYYGADESLFDPSTADRSKLRRELGIATDEPIVGMVAHFYGPLPVGPWTPPYLQGRAAKGHETLLRAARIVLRESPKVKFLLVGKGWDTVGEQYEAQLKRIAKEMGLEKAVIFTGPRADVPDVLASLDVSVQCSLNENLGGTIESLLMAGPTIATAVGGMPDSIRDGQTGLLVPPDNEEELAAAILRLLNNRQEALQLGQNGRRLMLREFTLAKTVGDIDRLYQSSVRTPRNRRSGSETPSTHYYRKYRILLNFCALSVVLPFVLRPLFRPLLVRQLFNPLVTAAAIFAALPVWAIMMLSVRFSPHAMICSHLRPTKRFAQPIERILTHAHSEHLDFSGLIKDLDELARPQRRRQVSP